MDLEIGRIYPPLGKIRQVSASIAVAVVEVAYKGGLAGQLPKPSNLLGSIRSQMDEPLYESYV